MPAAGQPDSGITPNPEPMLRRPLAKDKAIEINAAISTSSTPGPASDPLTMLCSRADFRNALDCLAAAIYFEAATQGEAGQPAVAQVVLNRVRHPAYPPTVCGVVFQGSERATGCQFTFTCDASMIRVPTPSVWARARAIAKTALSGSVFAPVGYATHYHADYVVPYWASSLKKSAVIGAHIFYRWSGHWGRPAAFRQRPAAAEPAYEALAAKSRGEPVQQAASIPVDGPELQSSGKGTVTAAVPVAAMKEVADHAPIPTLADQLAGRLLLDESPSESKDGPKDGGKPAVASAARTCSRPANVQAKPIGRDSRFVSVTRSRVGSC